MNKFDMGRAWNAATGLMGSHRDLVLAIAGVFLFLPSAVIGIFGPPEPPIEGVTPVVMLEILSEYFGEMLPYFLVSAILGSIGTIAIARLYLGARGMTVGATLIFALTVAVTTIIAGIISGIAVGFAALLLIVPGLYLYARFAMVLPHVATTGDKNPLTLLQGRWNATQGNGWRLVLYLVLIGIIGFIIYMLALGVVGLLFSALLPDDASRIALALLSALFGAVFSVVFTAILCGAYRELTGVGAQRLSDEFS